MNLKIGVIGLQGAVSEHINVTREAMETMKVGGEVVWIDSPERLDGCNGLIIPGGESTTIGKLMIRTGLFEKVEELGMAGVPILGTCAGMILLARKGDIQIERTKQPLLGLMNMEIVRNAFGRQRESFEADLDLPDLGIEKFRGVFIRAPAVKSVWGKARPIVRFQDKIVGVLQERLLALAFHPELAGDLRIHMFFLRMCAQRG